MHKQLTAETKSHTIPLSPLQFFVINLSFFCCSSRQQLLEKWTTLEWSNHLSVNCQKTWDLAVISCVRCLIVFSIKMSAVIFKIYIMYVHLVISGFLHSCFLYIVTYNWEEIHLSKYICQFFTKHSQTFIFE